MTRIKVLCRPDGLHPFVITDANGKRHENRIVLCEENLSEFRRALVTTPVEVSLLCQDDPTILKDGVVGRRFEEFVVDEVILA